MLGHSWNNLQAVMRRNGRTTMAESLSAYFLGKSNNVK